MVVREAGVGLNDDIGETDVAAAGFHSDSGARGAIADATPTPDGDTEDLCGGWFEKSSNQGLAADVIAFDVAEGWAQVWIGRTRTGTVASIAVPGQMATTPLA
ncbi:hypothetical protein [Streptomyces sp. NPDC088748]|uniref:hypothetical protein n=1 Tax=Streptomyces sp. NPDC088748 TaxID=3365887 RepID=UPI0037F64C4D